MKKFLLGFVLLLSTCPLFGQATNGFHRTAVALARAFQGVTAQVIPNAKVTVTSTATGLAATLYSDPALSSQITPSVVTADNSGNYGYYIALNYCVTETITSPGQGTQVITNICNNSVPGSGVTIQTNGVNNSSQILLNHVDTATVKWTNPSGGIESANVPAATNSSLGAAECDGVTTTCTSGVITSVSSAPGSPSGSKQFNNGGNFGGNAYILDASSFSGADMGAKIAAAIAALPSQGGTVDATNFSCPTACHIGTANLTVPANVTLILPAGTITRGEVTSTGLSAQILYSSYSTIIGQGKGVTVISGPSDAAAFQQAFNGAGILNPKINNLSIIDTGSVVSGSTPLQIGGPNSGIPFVNTPGTAVVGEIGSDYVYGDSRFPGYIAQFAVYATTLSPATIANHYTVGSGSTGYEAVVEASSPISYYPLKETTGTTANDLTGSKNGTYTGGVTLNSITGIPGDTSCGGVCKAPLFDGSTGYVELPSYTWLAGNNWTIEGWYYTNQNPATTNMRLSGFSSGGDVTLFTNDTSVGSLSLLTSYGGRADFGPGLTSGGWEHVVLTHSSYGLLLYLNGSQVAVGSDVLNGLFTDISTGGADIGTLMNGQHGCICYNTLYDVDPSGATAGLSAVNNSGYSFGENSNKFYGGVYGGATGISMAGSTKNKFYGPDIENASTHGIVLAGYGDYIIGPYEESNGCDVLGGEYNEVEGPLTYGGGDYSPCSVAAKDFVWGPDATPISIGVQNGIYFQSKNMFDDGANDLTYLYQPTGAYGLPLSLLFSGISLTPSPNGPGFYGHAPLSVGLLSSTGGYADAGSTSVSKLTDPSAPVITNAGTAGSTTYQYAVVCLDWNAGQSNISATGSTATGNASLSGTNYNIITGNCGDGYNRAAILKWSGSVWQTISNLTPAGATFTYHDTGQSPASYSVPSRNSTGDMTVAGNFTAANSPTFGFATLSSGTVTVSNAAACTPSASCTYKLTNCNTNSSAALGLPTVGTVSVGTSFVINSESALAAVVTTDNSKICWQIN